MLRIFITFAVSLITLGSLTAQSFIGKINPFVSNNPQAINSDTLKILCVMVNFQQDKDDATFGNGKFGSIYSKDYGLDILDPLPHNQDYFDYHLTFAKNYYERVSDSKLNISYTVLPDTFSVSKTMRNYAPIPNSDNFAPLGQFAEEVWTKADQMYPGFDFSAYDVFLIFHAGVGRDVSLPGSIGNERDLPSVYLSETAFKNFFGEDYEGIPVSNNSFRITNSMIIPETESRELETISGSYLFQITINGLLVASIASHLGVPDLYDTETGLSAIGRFGLMDGQSIFAYNGVFPPEPSAWEKIFLGWVEPVELGIGNYDVNVAARYAATLSDTVILKLPLNATEYYLIENRQRDVYSNGSILTIESAGNIFTKTFNKDTTGYYSYDTDSLMGVILQVDEYDWALPGNGIVIWHIDDNVITRNLSQNKINADKKFRGVDVEEADGVQDIGETFITIFGDQVIGEGTDKDFWYEGNKAELYKNVFSKDTRPSTETNSGANSLITIKNFSQLSNKMSFRIERGDSVVKPLFSAEISDFTQDSIKNITVINSSEPNDSFPLFALLFPNNILTLNDFNSTIATIPNFSGFKVASIQIGSSIYILGSIGSQINIITLDPSNLSIPLNVQNVAIDPQVTASLVIQRTSNDQINLLVGTLTGSVYEYDLQSIISNNPLVKDIHLAGEADHMVTQVSALDDEIAFITHSTLEQTNIDGQYVDEHGYYKFNNEYPVQVAMTKDAQSNIFSIVLTSTNNVYLIQGSNVISKFKIDSDLMISGFALADLKNDGNNYLVVNNRELKSYNLQGALADNFPFKDPDLIGFIGTPLVADIEGDSKSEIISLTNDGRIFAIDGGSGKIVEGFPLSTGENTNGSSVIFPYDNEFVYSTLAGQKLVGWVVSSINGNIDWAEILRNSANQSSLGLALNSVTTNEFFPTNRAYNYPNPVYDGQTAIRYYVNEDSKINIKIFDLAGDFVAELNNDAKGGFDNETIWNVKDIQSGVYLARIEAIGSSGKTESVIIKIAVVK